MEWGGAEWSGVEWSGVEWSGVLCSGYTPLHHTALHHTALHHTTPHYTTLTFWPLRCGHIEVISLLGTAKYSCAVQQPTYYLHPDYLLCMPMLPMNAHTMTRMHGSTKETMPKLSSCGGGSIGAERISVVKGGVKG